MKYDVQTNSQIKQALFGYLQDLTGGRNPADVYHHDASCQAMHPLGNLEGVDAIAAMWRGLRQAFPDMERRDLIFVGGENQEEPRRPGWWRAPHLVATLGHYQATFSEDYLGIPATGGVVHLRYAEAHWLDGDKIRNSWVIIDLLDLMRQAGVWPLPPSLGTEGMWPAPASLDGVQFGQPPEREQTALETVFAMHNALLSFDGKNLDTMDHGQYWTQHFMYYAASGVGMTRSLEGFRAHHQIPFLKAFPDRTAEGHFIRISDGNYAVTGGNVIGTHVGQYLGMPGTGKAFCLPVMDFYRLEGDKIAENWLPADMLGMAYGLGNDLLARVRHLSGHPVRVL